MNILKRFQAYAQDFEKTYVDDDWSRLEPYFAAGATYQVLGASAFPIDARGRAEVLAALRDAVDRFDRRCDSRNLGLLAPPEVDGDTVTIRWGGTYALEGAEDLRIEGIEVAHYNAAGEIERLVDTYGEEMADTVESWLAAHGHRLADPA